MRKKNMRRVLGVTLMGIFTLAGCGGAAGDTENGTLQAKTAEEYVQAATDALENAEGFEADFNAEISMDGSGAVSTDAKVAIRKKPLQARVDIHHDFDGASQASSIYLEEKGETVNLYMDYDEQWTEMTLSPEDAMNNVRIYDTADNMGSLLSAARDWQVEATEGDIVTVTAEIPSEKVFAVEENGRYFQLAGMSGLSETYFKDIGALSARFRFDWKTGQPVSYEIDFAEALESVTNNVLKELNGGVLENGVTVEKYLISSEITQLGDVESIEIPEAAKSDAINYEKEISLLENGRNP